MARDIRFSSTLRRPLAGAALVALATATPAAALGPGGQPIALGASVEGSLTGGDAELDSGEFNDRYMFAGRAGQRITIDLGSSAFDPYIFIRGPEGSDFAEDNDDAEEGNLNSRLTVTLPADGEYLIAATSFQPGETGDYALSVSDGPAPSAASDASGKPDAASFAPTPPERVVTSGTLAFGREARGELDDSANIDQDGRSYALWTLTGRPGERVSLTMQSEDFDTSLAAVFADGRAVTNDDDNLIGETTNSRIAFTMPADGAATIRATSFIASDTGAYTLLAEQGGAARGGPAEEVEAQPIALGQTVGGTLADDDSRTGSGRLADRYAFTGRRGQRVDLRLESEAFDPMLSITGPGGFAMANDDSDGTLDSRILATLPADGTYRLQATSFTRVAEGDYALIAGLNNSGEADTPIPVTTQARLGQVINGRLDPGDEAQGEQFVERYSFAGRRGQPVTVDLSSADFDTVVTLTTPSGEQQLLDDTGDSLDSRLERVLDEDGTYGVMVSSFGEGATGAYRLALSEGTSRIPANPAPRRIFAISVGISDYGGNTTDLDDTDHDAEKLLAKLEEQGLLARESVVLTNQQASTGEFERRFAEVASRAGPNDIFLFFYSGHGSQVDATADRRELDGRDETLTLADGQDFTDDRLAGMLANVRAGLTLIVLDSCFSGGFAQDVITRPNMMGLFASEEDLTSLVAGDLGAGGYLARFFNDALGGRADSNGDRNITSGELVAYLRYRYRGQCSGEYCLPVETGDGQQNYQELVVQRGSIQLDDILFVLPREGRGVAD